MPRALLALRLASHGPSVRRLAPSEPVLGTLFTLGFAHVLVWLVGTSPHVGPE